MQDRPSQPWSAVPPPGTIRRFERDDVAGKPGQDVAITPAIDRGEMDHDLSLSNRPDLVTDRLALRRPNDSDVDAIVTIVGNWDVARRLARVPHPYDRADARFFLDRVVPAEWVWAMTLHGSDLLLGAIGLTPEGAETAELGYWLSPAHWGGGLTTEAASAVIAFGFERLGLSVLTSGYFQDNPASGRVLQKLGFVETGRMMRPCLAAGHDVAAIRMELASSAQR